jgi:hypothetical protein
LADPWVTRIWPASDGTPTDLMFVPNCTDQNAGTLTCARRSGSSQIMVFAATCAAPTAFSQCSRARNSYSYSA